jgi:hypothetical protein
MVVVTISGERIASPGTISEHLVESLELLLEQARSGEIVGMAGVVTYPSKVGYVLPASDFCVGYTDSYAAVGALEDTKFQMLQRMND